MIGIGERPGDWLDDELRGWMHHYHQIGSVTDAGALHDAVDWIQDKVWVDRLEATIEAHILPTAEVREACRIPGTSLRTAWLCRDKPSMKEALRAGGRPDRGLGRASTRRRGPRVRRAVGYPLIIKPRAGAGAAGTSRVDNDTELAAALAAFGAEGVGSVAIEEFVEGHEGFYDTLSINGGPAYDFVCHYYPNVLEAMRTRWISPQFVSTNRVDNAGDYGELKEMGRRVNEALGIGTSATHMEWFFGPQGPAVLRDRLPAGRGRRLGPVRRRQRHRHLHRVGPADRARSTCTPAEPAVRRRHDRPAARPADGHDPGLLRRGGDAARYGEWVIDAHLPEPGTPTQPVEAGYMANAYVRMKHPDYDVLRGMLNDVGETITVHAG